MKSLLRYTSLTLLPLFVTGCATSTPVPGAVSDSKTWFLYVLFMAVAYGGSAFLLIGIPYRLLFAVDWRKRTITRKVSKWGVAGYFYAVMHMVPCLVYISDSTSYMFSVQVANDGLHYSSWGRRYVVSWSDVESADVVRANKGYQMLLVSSKKDQPLKISSQAYWDWDGFLAHVKGQMSRNHELAHYHPLTANSPHTDVFF